MKKFIILTLIAVLLLSSHGCININFCLNSEECSENTLEIVKENNRKKSKALQSARNLFTILLSESIEANVNFDDLEINGKVIGYSKENNFIDIIDVSDYFCDDVIIIKNLSPTYFEITNNDNLTLYLNNNGVSFEKPIE